jgi:transposase
MTLAEQQRPARRPKYDQRLLASLAAGKSYREAAKKAGCSYLTVTRSALRAELDDISGTPERVHAHMVQTPVQTSTRRKID